jgi:CheY-like chemotaxis protein
MMGGRIWVESRCNEGSTFSFTAKFGACETAADAESTIDLKQMNILVADDNTTSLRVLGDMLSSWNAQPLLAGDADSTMAALERAEQSGAPCPIVLLDADLSASPGGEPGAGSLAAQISARFPALGMVMMLSTAGDLAGPGRRRLQTALTTIVKPISKADLRSAILGIGEVRDGEKTAGEFPNKRPSPLGLPAIKLQIMLVEDNPVNRKVAVRLLEKQGHTVITANNGREALQLLSEINWQCDLILMDVQMPEMDGYQATAAIRELEIARASHLPIVAMTAHALDRDRERCLAAGMDGYLTKPIRMEKLLEVLDSIGAALYLKSA